MMKNCVLALAIIGSLAAPCLADDGLVQAFLNPPDSAKPWVYWFWINGNISKEGITADLESFKRVGVGGVLWMEVSGQPWAPAGRVQANSVEWHDAIQWAIQECARLGIEFDISVDYGYGSGGPHITPEQSMQQLVWSTTQVEGGKALSLVLPKPKFKRDLSAWLKVWIRHDEQLSERVRKHLESDDYKDVAVLACPLPEGASHAPKLTASSNYPKYPPALAEDSRDDTRWISNSNKPGMGPTPEKPEYLQFDYDEAWPAAGLYLTPYRDCGPKEIEIQCSDDGKTYRTLRRATVEPNKELVVPLDEVQSAHFRVVFLSSHPFRGQENWNVQVAEIALLTRAELKNPRSARKGTWQRDATVDLTEFVDGDGRLTWDAPPGKWRILRFGHASKRQLTRPSPAPAVGLECDRLSRSGIDAHYAGFLKPIFEKGGEKTGKTLSYVHIDSWEAGNQNWTATFPAEFLERRGYDVRPWLPVLAGHVVGSAEQSRRFEWDFRRTGGEMICENYAGRLRELAAQHGIKLSIEAYGNVCINNLKYAGVADMPMSEFWVAGKDRFPARGRHFGLSTKAMTSVAHVYGKPVVGAEAFTTGRAWSDHPYLLKGHGDYRFCEGLNRMVMVMAIHQPYDNMVPGLTHRRWGEHFDRYNTWWEYSRPWMDYMARCQYLLRQGRFVADVCYFFGEGAPLNVNDMKLDMPEGYDFNFCPAEMVLHMDVKDGRIVLPSGMSYRYLLLPQNTDTMTLPLARKVKQLIADGARVIAGPRLKGSPGLEDFPRCDKEIQDIAAWMWDGGRVIPQKKLADVFVRDGLPPDFQGKGLGYIHRRDGKADIYFVSNQTNAERTVTCTFRVADRQPELWDPESGRIRELPEFHVKNGRTSIPLSFGPVQSWFVLFRNPVSTTRSVEAKNFTSAIKKIEVTGPWTVSFDPKWGGPDRPLEFERLIDWSKHGNSGVHYYSGDAIYRRSITLAEADIPKNDSRLLLDLGAVGVMARVEVNGKECGIAWKPPYRVDISDAVRSGENSLEVQVVNLWVNRLIGDEQLPLDSEWKNFETLVKWPDWFTAEKPRPSGRYTFTSCRHYTKDSPLLPSGLLGPVTIQVEE